MAKCDVCDKGIQTGNKVSRTRSRVSRRYKRNWKPNVQKVRIVDENGTPKRIHMCTRCMKTNIKNNTIMRAN